MGRLIDADKLIDHIEKVKNESASLVDMAHIIGFQSVIDAQPTAYDVNAVVEQLQKNADKNRGFYKANLNDNAQGQMIAYLHAIEIVKGGGVDGN